jgi:broad specificity phosphatase PhoE
METAELVSGATAASIAVDDRLVEWGLSSRWAGTSWEALSEVFPGELEAYLEDPYDLPFSPESLDAAGKRVARCVEDWTNREPGDVAFVSHQDPIHAAVLGLTAEAAPEFHSGKPAHCSITTLERTGTGWAVTGHWAPPSEPERRY